MSGGLIRIAVRVAASTVLLLDRVADAITRLEYRRLMR